MFRLVLGLAALLGASDAWAADQAQYAPVPDWVKPVEIPQPSKDSKTDTQVLLEDFQNNFGADGDDFYEEIAELVQTPQGLDRVGSVVLEWRPDTEALIIHKLHIIRDGQVIDVLASGQKFLVLRRENNLEMAMLDGSLTAAIQPEGLQVGDVLDIAFTVQDRDPLFKGRSQLFMRNPGTMPIRHLHIRELWPKSKSLQWRQTEGLDAAKVNETPDGTELLIDMPDAQLLKPPRQAPGRFSNFNALQITEFPKWSDVSALMAPLYEKATHLADSSPIKAEAAKIASASADPKVRAAEALRLVQNKIRYLFLGMDRGGYVPADADRTWTRRFGDCKGKTVLLLSLLHELGIEAEPAVVSSSRGDGLDSMLPTARAFDHVLVRARIDGKTYWLDGTRTGDRTLDDISTPRFFWALPIQAAGAELEKLETKPFQKPETLTTLRIDASSGLDVPAPAHAERVLRGEAATGMRLTLSGKSPTELESHLRQFWTGEYDSIDIKHVDYTFDDKAGEAHLTMDGTAKMTWKVYRGDAGRQYRVEGSRLGWTADYTRDPGPHRDAPYSVRFPFFEQIVATVVLPNGGAGFTIEGADVSNTIGGYELKRTSRIAKGVFTMTVGVRSIASEFPSSEAPTAKTALKDLSEVAVYLKAPASLAASGPSDVNGNGHMATVPVLRAEASEAMAKGDLEAGKRAFDQALSADPNNPEFLAGRAYVELAKGDVAAANADIAKAAKADGHNKYVQSIQVTLALVEKRFPDAAAIADQLVQAYPGDPKILALRVQASVSQGNFDKALADLDQAIQIDANDPQLRILHANLLVQKRDATRALADADKLVALAPESPDSHDLRGYVLAVLGRREEARVEYNASLAIRPTAGVYFRRAKLEMSENMAAAHRDLEEAIKLDPRFAEALSLRATLYLALANFDAARDSLESALAVAPDNVELMRKRAVAFAGMHNYDAAIAELNLLLAKRPNAADLLMERCAYKAAKGTADAASDCALAAQSEPNSDDILLIGAFAKQRAGKVDQAIDDYNDLLRRRPGSASAYFCRAMAEIARRREDKAKDDLLMARAINSRIDVELAPLMEVPAEFLAGNPDMEARQAKFVMPAEDHQDHVQQQLAGGRVSRKPLTITRPEYPQIAEDYQNEGWVDFEFTVEADGSVSNAKVTREYPEIRGFADAAVKVFPKWKFTPQMVDGKAVATHAYYRFSFKLAVSS